MSFPDSLRKTKSRLKVWEILEKSSTPLTARQIAKEAEGSDSKGVWISSVYRALEAFEEAHAVSRTFIKDSPEALYSLSETGHHHYAICMNCKSRTELPECPFTENKHLHTADDGFMVVGHTVEVFGYCKDCQDKMKKDK
ncbi:MAG: transcriptional repressor [Clostridiales bacterium]|nr:transcriptional repressor [Clostridiales bacterium]MBR6254297.1 transcriptional repressor [Clostridiales bacterium]MCR5274338.1 transcriptional repressor [Clostridiales bacterium]